MLLLLLILLFLLMHVFFIQQVPSRLVLLIDRFAYLSRVFIDLWMKLVSIFRLHIIRRWHFDLIETCLRWSPACRSPWIAFVFTRGNILLWLFVEDLARILVDLRVETVL